MSRDKIFHGPWRIPAALSRSFFSRRFKRGEGPGVEVDAYQLEANRGQTREICKI